MTSEYNFGVNPLYADMGSPIQNMAKNEYVTLDNYSYFRSPNRNILSPFVTDNQNSMYPLPNYTKNLPPLPPQVNNNK